MFLVAACLPLEQKHCLPWLLYLSLWLATSPLLHLSPCHCHIAPSHLSRGEWATNGGWAEKAPSILKAPGNEGALHSATPRRSRQSGLRKVLWLSYPWWGPSVAKAITRRLRDKTTECNIFWKERLVSGDLIDVLMRSRHPGIYCAFVVKWKIKMKQIVKSLSGQIH